MVKKRRCGRCRELYPVRDLTSWLGDDNILSPEFCRGCYDWILTNYEEGMDVEAMLDD